MGMGLPTVAVLEEETDARNNNTTLAAAFGDSVNIEDDPASTLEEKARRALECPCLADLRNGPCGGEFTDAFGCFVKSQEPEKGSDCIEPFKNMQRCMTTNAREFSSVDVSAAPMPLTEGGHRLPTEENEESEADDQRGGVSRHPPGVPESSLRLPLWLKKQSENQGSK